MKRDYYELLGVKGTASLREIRLAYQRLARQYSPDVNPWDSQSATIFQEIVEAYRILSDASLRNLYDRLGLAAFTGAGRDRMDAAPRSRAVRGEDLHYPIELSFEDSVRGLTATLEVHRFGACSACGGTGILAGTSPDVCPYCGGSGEGVRFRGTVKVPSLCKGCGGSGEVIRIVCEPCKGKGVVPVRAQVPVTIPPGVDTGSEVRVKGEGHAGSVGAPSGDLVLITRVQPHPFFARKGDNLHCEIPVTVTEAALGAKIEVPTPGGSAFMILPPGTQSGQVFRLRGKGVSRLHGDGRGDLYVTPHVVIPKEISSSTEELFRDLERLMPVNPRSLLFAHRGSPRKASHE